MSELENPWATEAGQAARLKQLRYLATGEGAFADFAADVLAGRASLRSLLGGSMLADDDVQEAVDRAQRWRDLPEAERQVLMEDGREFTEWTIAALNKAPDPG